MFQDSDRFATNLVIFQIIPLLNLDPIVVSTTDIKLSKIVLTVTKYLFNSQILARPVAVAQDLVSVAFISRGTLLLVALMNSSFRAKKSRFRDSEFLKCVSSKLS
jgi:hypothetical protein